tara:strand:- start:2233 stop:2901 length:669 start_codon:yes stop_codon:yes gene_type:complete
MAKVEVQALNPVYLDEANVADVNITPPIGFARWRAVHNLHSENLNILAPSNEIYRYFAEDGDDRSDVYNPLNSGKLDENQSILGSASSTETSATGSFSADSSGTVTVTRAAGEFTGTLPSFDGIDYDGDALTAIVVNAEGTGLEEGDVISFACNTNTGVTVSITVGENDLQLGAGLHLLKVTTMAVAAVIPANHLVQLPSFSQIQIQATDNGNDATAVCYFG